AKKTEEEGRKGRFGEGPEEDATGRIPGFQTAGITRFSNRRSQRLTSRAPPAEMNDGVFLQRPDGDECVL
ncbi:MAG: hypothetical protein AB7O66_22335, partial [Limisphaerales bacterium]